MCIRDRFHADGLCRRNGLCIVGNRVKIHADILLDCLDHCQPRPAGRQVDLFTHPFQFIRAKVFLRKGSVNTLGNVHHVVEVGIGLIQLHGGKPVSYTHLDVYKRQRQVLLVQTLYVDTLRADCFTDRALLDKCYPQRDLHTVYVGKVLGAYEQ